MSAVVSVLRFRLTQLTKFNEDRYFLRAVYWPRDLSSAGLGTLSLHSYWALSTITDSQGTPQVS